MYVYYAHLEEKFKVIQLYLGGPTLKLFSYFCNLYLMFHPEVFQIVKQIQPNSIFSDKSKFICCVQSVFSLNLLLKTCAKSEDQI